MPTNVPKDVTVAALGEVWASIDDLAAGLTDDEWHAASPLPGWDVQDNIAHILGTEAFLLGRQPAAMVDADGLAHVRNPIGAMNENWVATYAGRSPADVLADFRDVTTRRLAVLDAMPQEQWDAVGFTPAGEDAYGRFMQIRVFDCWMHEQDIRAAIGRPGHESGIAVEVSLDEMSTAMGYVVGKRAGVPAGASITFDLVGDPGRRIHVLVGERAQVVADLPGPATATIELPVVSFSRIAGGRLDAGTHEPQAVITGDEELGRRVLQNLSYTI